MISKLRIVYPILVLFVLSACAPTLCPGNLEPKQVSLSLVQEIKAKIDSGSEEALQHLLSSYNLTAQFAPKNLIVKFKEGTSSADIETVVSNLSAHVRHQFRSNGALLIEVPSAITRNDVLSVATLLRQVTVIEYISADYIVKTNAIPNDPDFNKLYGLNNSGQTNGIKGADVHATEAWNLTVGSRNVLVGIIDSGVDYNHPDIAPNYWTNPGESGLDANGQDKRTNGIDDDGNGYVDDWRGWNFVGNNNDPMDDFMHGTHVAGTIGAAGNNGIGVSGVNWNVSMVGIKFIDKTGNGTLSNAIKALEYANSIGASITNNSWGGGSYDETLMAAIAAARSKGYLFVAAAGNDGRDTDSMPSYPASYPLDNVIAVAATDASDKLAYFSNFGRNSVHLAAPGVDIFSTLLNNSYGPLSGTSMATPHVAGAAALIKAYFPTANYKQIKARLLYNVDKIAGLTEQVQQGGRLNIIRALAADNTPPGGIEPKVIYTGLQRVVVQFAPAGEDGSSGSASDYEVRVSAQPIDSEAKWEAASPARTTMTTNGTSVRVTVSGLSLRSSGYLAVRAIDHVGNVGPISKSLSYAMSEPKLVYEKRADSMDGLSTTEGWGIEYYAPLSTNVFSDSPGKNYENKAHNYLTFPSITMPGDEIILEFDSVALNCEPGVDYVSVEYQAGDGLWTPFAAYSNKGCAPAHLRFSLTDQLRKASSFQFRFVLVSNDSGTDDGWLINNIQIFSAPLPRPTFTDIHPIIPHQAEMHWTGSDLADTIYVDRATSAQGPFQLVATLPAGTTAYTDTVPVSGSYFYRLRFSQGGFLSDASPVTGLTIAPKAPILKSVTVINGTQPLLTWEDTSDDEDYFIVQRANSEFGNFSDLGLASAGGTQMADYTITAPGTYYYRVYSYRNNNLYSISSSVRSVNVTAPIAPNGLVARVVSAPSPWAGSTHMISLSWNDRSNNETRFRVEKASAFNGAFSGVASVGENVKTVQISNISGVASVFRVVAINSLGTGISVQCMLAPTGYLPVGTVIPLTCR